MINENLLVGSGTVLSPERIMLGSVIMLLAATLATVAIASLVRRDRARLGPTTRRFCRTLSVRRRVLRTAHDPYH